MAHRVEAITSRKGAAIRTGVIQGRRVKTSYTAGQRLQGALYSSTMALHFFGVLTQRFLRALDL